MELKVKVGRKYTCEYPCFRAAVDAYHDNYIAVELSRHSTAEWIELCEKGLPGCEKLAEPVTGCLLLFKYRDKLWHVGVYLGNGKFYHTHAKRTAIERLSRYKKSYIGAYQCQI